MDFTNKVCVVTGEHWEIGAAWLRSSPA